MGLVAVFEAIILMIAVNYSVRSHYRIPLLLIAVGLVIVDGFHLYY